MGGVGAAGGRGPGGRGGAAVDLGPGRGRAAGGGPHRRARRGGGVGGAPGALARGLAVVVLGPAGFSLAVAIVYALLGARPGAAAPPALAVRQSKVLSDPEEART
jgi:hypothetical protein